MTEATSQQTGLLIKLTALFAAFCGLYLLIGGGWRVTPGDAWYSPMAGVLMLVVTALLWRGKRAALWLYALVLLATMLWGVREAGFDFWALILRSDILLFFGLWLILPFVGRQLIKPSRGAVAALMIVLLMSAGILTWSGFHDPQEMNVTLSTETTPA